MTIKVMGRIVKQVSAHKTRYYWYPGDKKDWVRAGVALGVGMAGFTVVGVLTRDPLTATVVGTSATAGVAGVNFGRRDARALAGFSDLNGRAARRAAIVHSGRAAWRALAEGVGGAGAAVLIVNLPARGIGANWLLPIVPAVVGALAHQSGMLYERLGNAAPRVPAAWAAPRLPAGPAARAAARVARAADPVAPASAPVVRAAAPVASASAPVGPASVRARGVARAPGFVPARGVARAPGSI